MLRWLRRHRVFVVQGSEARLAQCSVRTVALDLPALLEFVPSAASAAAAGDGGDAGSDWTRALTSAGFDSDQPCLVVSEGLLTHLSHAAAARLLRGLGRLCAPGSVLLCDMRNSEACRADVARSARSAGAGAGAASAEGPSHNSYGFDDPRALLAKHGWSADVREFGQSFDVDFGRIPQVAHIGLCLLLARVADL